MLKALCFTCVFAVPVAINAEEMRQRTPADDHGAIALAIVSWCAAAAAMFAMARRADVASAVDPRIVRRQLRQSCAPVSKLAQVALGVGVVVCAATAVGLGSRPQPPMRPGWSIIRPPQDVSSLALDGEVVWAGGTAGLASIDRRTGRIQPSPDCAQRYRFVRDLLVDRDHALWIAHGQGIARVTSAGCRQYAANDGISSGAALAVLQDRDGAVWVGTERGAFRFDGQRFTPAFDGVSVAVIYQARDGSMWFGSDDPEHGELRSFDGQHWRVWSVSDGLAHRAVNAITQDRTGALWFATGFSGSGAASRFDQGRWQSYTQRDGLAGPKVRSVFEDRAGRVWFGSEYDGIAVTDGRRWRTLTPRDGLAGLEVKRVVQDADGVYWLGTDNGINRIQKFELDQ